MARIRTIKPEFWSSPGVTKMSPWARLAFIAMWNWADDFGRGTYEPRELMGFIFPREDDMTVGEFRQLVGEIHLHVGVMFYNVSGRHYYEITTWKTHQKTDPRMKRSKFPGPDDGYLINPVNMSPEQDVSKPHQHVDVLHPHVDESHGNPPVGTGEQGNRGTGEQSLKDLSDSDESDVSDPQPDAKPKRHDYSPEFETFWSTYPTARGASKFETAKKFDTALKAADADTIINGAAAYRDDPNRTDEYTAMPTTWLHNRRWEAGPLPARNSSAPNHGSAPGRRFGTHPDDWGPQPEPPTPTPDYTAGHTIIDNPPF